MASLTDVLAQIRQRESGGDYTLTPQQNFAYPSSHASGAYQFQPGTWQTLTQQSGIGTQYAQAYQAPPNVQDAVAAYAAEHGNVNSTSLWGASAGSNPYPQIDPSTYIDPSQIADGAMSFTAPSNFTGAQFGDWSSAPVANTTASGDPLLPPAFADPGNPYTGQGATENGTLPSAQSAAQWWNNAVTITGDYLTRFGLVLLALILIAAGVWALASGSDKTKIVRAAMRAIPGE